MDAEIDFNNSRNDARNGRNNAKNAGSNGKMNGGDPLTDGVSFGNGNGLGWLYNMIPWALAGAGTIIATLSGIIYRKQETLITELQAECKLSRDKIDKLRLDVDECQDDRAQLHIKVALLEKELEFIKQKITDKP